MLSKDLDVDAVDPEVVALVREEYDRQAGTICLIPSENHVPQAVLEGLGIVFTNKYSKGMGRHYLRGPAGRGPARPLRRRTS